MTDKQFEFIVRSVLNRLQQSLHSQAFRCTVNPEHPDPQWREREVVDICDIDETLRITFNEIMEEEL
jgi:hypothetical protein